jgi:hypothetical protein
MIVGQVAKFNSVLRKAYSHVLLEQMERTFDHIIYNVYGREIKPLSHYITFLILLVNFSASM